MASGTIHPGVISIASSGYVTIETAGGYGDISITWTPPSGGTFLCETIERISTTRSFNDVRVLVPSVAGTITSGYRVVSDSAQTVTVFARRLYSV